MDYNYKGRDNSGEAVSGAVTASDKQDAAKQLKQRGIAVSSLSQTAKSMKAEGGEPTAAGVDRAGQHEIKGVFFDKNPSLDDWMLFCHQMHTLLRGGVTLVTSLHSVLPFIENKILKSVLALVVSDLESGYTVPQALGRHKRYVPDVMLGMAQAGEETGNLEVVFLKLSEHFAKEKETKDKIRGVLRYPAIVFSVIIAALLIMNMMVIPVFSKIFLRFGSELPFLTQVLLDVSAFINNYWQVMLTVAGVAFVGWGRWVNSDRGREVWDEYKLKLPFFGIIMHRGTLSQLCHSISMTFASGLPILQGLKIAGEATGNRYFIRKAGEMTEGLEEGRTLVEVADKSTVFHPLAMQMLSAGELTGSIDDTLSRVAYYYDREIEKEIKALSEKIEPFLILGVGIMVLVLALGIFIPLWDMSSVILNKGR